MPMIQYDAKNKELVVNIAPDEKQYDQLGREIHEDIFKQLDCIFRNVGLLPESCAAVKNDKCSFPMGWKIRESGTKKYYTCDVWNKNLYRK